MEIPLQTAATSQILARLQNGDFTILQEMRESGYGEEKSLYELALKYHELFSGLRDYFEEEDCRIRILSLTCEERLPAS